jgi:hypothetical protein
MTTISPASYVADSGASTFEFLIDFLNNALCDLMINVQKLQERFIVLPMISCGIFGNLIESNDDTVQYFVFVALGSLGL